MELYASGFNAWNQLLFGEELVPEPDDIWEFRRVLRGDSIRVLRAGLSTTLVKTSAGQRLAGVPDEVTEYIQENEEEAGSIAVAGNGKVANTRISEFKSWTDFPNHPSSSEELDNVQQIVAGQTSFAALRAGEVWTWGDERYSACLGRDISRGAGNTASRASRVTDLASLPTGPIVKIAAGGYVNAALTAGRDLYLWGVSAPLGLEGVPMPLDLQGKDILDVGVGDGHVIVLTEDQRVWVIGEGVNGQLGMGKGLERLAEWKEVDLKLDEGREIIGLAAGPKCSLVLVRVVES